MPWRASNAVSRGQASSSRRPAITRPVPLFREFYRTQFGPTLMGQNRKRREEIRQRFQP